MADQFSHGVQVDATAEVELREWAISQPGPDYALEDLAEFSGGCRDEDRRERELTRMESAERGYGGRYDEEGMGF